MTIDIKDLGTHYTAVDLKTGSTSTIQVICMEELPADDGFTIENLTGFFSSPFCLTYYKPKKGAARKQAVQEAIRQTLAEGNSSVLIDFA